MSDYIDHTRISNLDANLIVGKRRVVLSIAALTDKCPTTIRNNQLEVFSGRTRYQQAFHVGIAWAGVDRQIYAYMSELTTYFTTGATPPDHVVAERRALTEKNNKPLGGWAAVNRRRKDGTTKGIA